MSFEQFLLQLTIILVAAKLGAELAHRLGQPAVLGELLAGLMVGGSVLKIVTGQNELMQTFAELGAVLLLFEIGLECDLAQLLRIGGLALYAAFAGVIVSFVAGYVVCAQLGLPPMVAIFLGAALTATSPGITARVFSDMKRLQSKEAQIVLGAAIADDIIGLVILAVVSGLAIDKMVSFVKITRVTGIALVFLITTMLIGLRAAPMLVRLLDRARTRGVLVTGVMALCFFVSMLSAMSGLAPIIGAFAAGLLLARTEKLEHIQDRIKPIAELLIPVFFVVMGSQMNVSTLSVATESGRATLLLAALLFVAAVFGKAVGCGSLPARGLNRYLVGFGMVPRGEVILIYAGTGLKHRILTESHYTAILAVLMATTLVAPPLLKWIIERSPQLAPPTAEVELTEAPEAVL